MNDDVVIDLSIIEELKEFSDDEGTSIVCEALNLYLEDSPIQVKGLIEGLKKNDLEQVERNAHSLRGSSATLGGVRLAKLCESLEQMSRQHTLVEVDEYVARVAEEATRLQNAMKIELNRLSAN
jgi:HPt (histidine-containing phosphotransfer) domain-containing protein